jgi:hypothetical protein
VIAGGEFVGLMPQPLASHELARHAMVELALKEGALQATLAASCTPQEGAARRGAALRVAPRAGGTSVDQASGGGVVNVEPSRRNG